MTYPPRRPPFLHFRENENLNRAVQSIQPSVEDLYELAMENIGIRGLYEAMEAAQSAIATLQGTPWGSGQLIEGVYVDAWDSTDVAHTLGRDYEGYIVINPIAPSRIFMEAYVTANEQSFSAGASGELNFTASTDPYSLWDTSSRFLIPRVGRYNIAFLYDSSASGSETARAFEMSLRDDTTKVMPYFGLNAIYDPTVAGGMSIPYLDHTDTDAEYNIYVTNTAAGATVRVNGSSLIRSRLQVVELGETQPYTDPFASTDPATTITLLSERSSQFDLWVY